MSTITNSNGSPTVVTIVASNAPTTIANNDNATQTSQLVFIRYVSGRMHDVALCFRFFRNKGAVAAVFVIVGLAAASIVLFMFFYIRKRRRNQQLEHDTAVASTLAAAGYNRRPLDGDEDEEKGQPSTPAPSATISSMHNSTPSLAALNLYAATGLHPPPGEGYAAPPTPGGIGGDFDPYATLGVGASGGSVSPPPPAQRRDGYLPARTSSPPPGAYTRRPAHSTSTSASSMGWGHAAKGSISSTEPLLSGYFSGATTEPSTPALGATLNLAGASGGVAANAERPGARESASTMSVYSVDEPEEPETRGKLEVRLSLCVTDHARRCAC